MPPPLKPKESSKSSGRGGGDVSVPNFESGEAALVVFAVVGLVMIIAWIPYFPILAYDAIIGKKDHAYVHMASLQYTGFFDHSSKVEKSGSLSGGKYSFLINNLGLASELGYFDIKIQDRLQGAYWLVGPSIIFTIKDKNFIKTDLLGGSSFGSKLGLVSRADFSFNFKIPKTNLSTGAGVGALYLHVNEDRGLLTSRNNLDLVYTLNVSQTF